VTTWDISFPIREGMPGFPGDPSPTLRPVSEIAHGAPYNLSLVSMGTHTGTHVDPPVHFLPGGDPIDRVDVARLNGPATVVRVAEGVPSIDRSIASAVPVGTERVLFRTVNSTRWDRDEGFFADYVALDPEGAGELLRRGVRLVGLDALSIERDAGGKFPVHHALLGGGALILEGLRLGAVEAGEYELRCLPLRLVGGDGGPARAILYRA
jgi:arylformamidase